MPSLDEIIARTVRAAGGTIYGRLKIQKMLYLLDQKGLDSGASYFYHHYGPYSEDISDAIMDAKFFGSLNEKVGHRQMDGAPYSFFEIADNARVSDYKLSMSEKEFSRLVQKFQQINATVLEIASTIHWIAKIEKIADWRTELIKRKASKASPERIDSALRLLKEIELTI